MDIGIIGLGLIGGSLSLDLRAAGHRILGVSRRMETCQQAIARGIVDSASPHLDSLTTAEMVFICTPIAAICPTVQQLTTVLKSDAIITDVGSVKSKLVSAATALWPNFVGGHPMAGKSEAGLAVAEPRLFAHRPYVLTPIDQTRPQALHGVKQLVQNLGANLYECSPTEHDYAVAWISHLPVMISTSLLQACLGEPDTQVLQLAQQLASSGFCDTSRVGGGNPELGTMMAQFNRSALLHTLTAYRQQLDDVIDLIDQHRWPELQARLAHSQAHRPRFLDSPR